MHRASQHHAELMIGKLKHIREALFGGLTACTEDFLQVNGILHRLELGGGQFGGRGIHPAQDKPRAEDLKLREPAGGKIGRAGGMALADSGSAF